MKMTDKQKAFIEKICDVLDYDFTCKMREMSVEEASAWIDENIEDYRYYTKGSGR